MKKHQADHGQKNSKVQLSSIVCIANIGGTMQDVRVFAQPIHEAVREYNDEVGRLLPHVRC